MALDSRQPFVLSRKFLEYYRLIYVAYVVSKWDHLTEHMFIDRWMIFQLMMHIPYSQKIWRGIKFGGLAVWVETAKLKSTNIIFACNA